jgi:hypothetical protein
LAVSVFATRAESAAVSATAAAGAGPACAVSARCCPCPGRAVLSPAAFAESAFAVESRTSESASGMS